MAVTIKLPTPLRRHAKTVQVAAVTVGEALGKLVEAHPAMRDSLFDGEGRVKQWVRVFLGERDIDDLGGVDTPVTDGDAISIIPPIAGA
jgi:molybdopterin converting factor small subunit